MKAFGIFIYTEHLLAQDFGSSHDLEV